MTEYFGTGTAERREGDRGSFTHIDDVAAIDVGGGVVLRPVCGDRLLLSYVVVEPNGEAPMHTHDEEQMGIVISGTCTFELDGEVRTVGPGDVYHAPPGVPHGVRTGSEPCVIVDIFAPPRRALVERMHP
jgi:quercetin dioxygenase-like cupin family protein